MRIGRFLRKLVRDRRAVAMTEFALSAPLLLTAGLYGLETVNLAITHMRVSQAAMQIADNASRIGDTSTLTDRKIYESDINDLLRGADYQTRGSTDLFEHGRAIISSLETIPDRPGKKQFIHWQRCMGAKNAISSYGEEGDGLSGNLKGMGPKNQMVQANEGDAVIFVEVIYDYQPLVTSAFVGLEEHEIRVFSAFNVRDNRDLSGIHQRDAGAPDPAATCDKFETF